MYYVCNNPDPMTVASIPAKLYALSSDAFNEAIRLAELYPEGSAYYVHIFAPSRVIFKASATVTINSEMLNGPSES